MAKKSDVAAVSLESGARGVPKSVRMATLDGSVRGPVNGGSRQSEAPDSAEDSKSIRPGRPVKRIVRAVLHDLGLLGR